MLNAQNFCSPRPQSYYLTAKSARGKHIFEQLREGRKKEVHLKFGMPGFSGALNLSSLILFISGEN